MSKIALMLSGSDVLNIIDPIDPENLQPVGDGVWVAKWVKPVPMWQVDALENTEGIKIVKSRYEPENLPDWLAVHFSIHANAVRSYKRFMNGESDFK